MLKREETPAFCFDRYLAAKIFLKLRELGVRFLRRLRQPRSSGAERFFCERACSSYQQCGRGLPRAGGSGGHSCERGYFLFRQVARGRATPKGGFWLRRLGLQRSLRSRPRVNTRGSPKRNFVRYALSVTVFHFFGNVLRVSAAPREILLALTHTVLFA